MEELDSSWFVLTRPHTMRVLSLMKELVCISIGLCKIDCLQLVHEAVMGCLSWVFAFFYCFFVPQMLGLLKRRQVNIVSQMAEERGRDSPKYVIGTCRIFLLLPFVYFFCLFSINYLMESCLDVATSDLLEHDTSLE